MAVLVVDRVHQTITIHNLGVFVAALKALRENETWILPSTEADGAWQGGELLPGFERRTVQWAILRYGRAVAAMVAATAIWLTLSAWLGLGLPSHLIFYPASMAVALTDVWVIGLSMHVASHTEAQLREAGASACLDRGPIDAIVQTILACPSAAG